jgi:hypothetical protein
MNPKLCWAAGRSLGIALSFVVVHISGNGEEVFDETPLNFNFNRKYGQLCKFLRGRKFRILR